jgi:holo-[acyl-carrier protein] synthase
MKVGVDIVEVKRIERILKRYGERFLNRIYTKREIEICIRRKDKILCLAGKFAAKEAVMKSLGVGFKTIAFREIEILNKGSGEPYVVFSDRVKNLIENKKFSVSISDTDEYAVAVCLNID